MSRKRVVDDDFYDGERIVGTCIAYAVSDRWVTGFVADVDIEDAVGDIEHYRTKLRAWRLARRRQDKSVPRLRTDALGTELMITMGPELSPEQVIAYLQAMIAMIQNDGLLIGRRQNGDLVYESVDHSRHALRRRKQHDETPPTP
jgi:hypothetical protein